MCPRTKEQNDAIREGRKQQIRAAAADILLERGAAIEIRDVALKAGLGYGTVYHYYRNKHQLLDELLTHAFEAAQEVIAAELDYPANISIKDPSLLLRRYCASLLQLWLDDHVVFFLYRSVADNGLSLPGGGLPAHLAEQFDTQLYRPLVMAVRSCNRNLSAKELDDAANFILGSLIGCAGLHIYRQQTPMDIEQTISLLLAAFIREESVHV
ncbi:TetR/AcrR family transcriptional regulator [Paenibacillus sp. GCM10027626]|uniref:TetR/AcrR family transcriptional regulator n=1 Tax=Paenibacillus sp. GCM10027626 TaxID=3273411 RepID=UPI003640D973